VSEMLEPGMQSIQLTGQLSDGTLFAGNDTVRVLASKSNETAPREVELVVPKEFVVEIQENPQQIDDRVETDEKDAFDVGEAIVFTLYEVGETIKELGPESFINEGLVAELIHAIDDVFMMLDEGMYYEALVFLEDNILARTDGCANIGEPDEDDWIISFEGQESVYSLVLDSIELLESFI